MSFSVWKITFSFAIGVTISRENASQVSAVKAILEIIFGKTFSQVAPSQLQSITVRFII